MLINLIVLFLILSIYSFLYKDNVFFKFTERFVVGISAAYGFIKLFQRGFIDKLYIPLSHGNLAVIFPALLGLLFFGTLNKKTAFLAKFPLAFLLGIGAGLEIGPRIETDIVKQIYTTIIYSPHSPWFTIFNNIIIIIALFATMYYFLFVLRKNRPIDRIISKTGIFFLMVGFGASFGYTIMARISLLIEVIKTVIHFF
ncbi:hypothetical protein J7L48_08635 [bacterium]|nr:hypothetical protein [bacterium]